MAGNPAIRLVRGKTTLNSCSLTLEALLSKYAGLFRDELGEMKGVKATIHMDPAATPQFPPSFCLLYTSDAADE